MTAESFLDGKVMLHSGDCLDVLKTLASNSVDSIVTDPPYGLEFMGKGWDGADGFRRSLNKADAGRDNAFGRTSKRAPEYRAGTLFQEFIHAVAIESLRVLKPGGHLVAFGGTRTYHRLTCAIEDAGFEIRDSILDLFATDQPIAGFLASLNDEQRGAFVRCVEESQFGGLLAWVYGSGFPKSLDVSKAIDKAAGAEREVLRERYTVKRIKPGATVGAEGEWGKQEIAYTATDSAPATEDAAKWSGFGTALKPACEPICLARKPLIGTVAENVLQHGTGALNIDGCRVATDEQSNRAGGRRPATHEGYQRPGATMYQDKTDWSLPKEGRWPANVIHDGSDEVVGAFPETKSGALTADQQINGGWKGTVNCYGTGARGGTNEYDASSGSAARFFYTAKADADDRLGSKHPTVKPLDLMQWLVRLVTPPCGLVLDPFSGTGTTGEAAWREGFRAILIERESEYQADIRRRMALCLSGPDERKRESTKARMKDKPADHGPLFAGSDTPRRGRQIYGVFADEPSGRRD